MSCIGFMPAANGPGADENFYQRASKRRLFVILSGAKNLSFLAAEIRKEAALRSE
jgi:hypothetical protein